MGCFNLNLIIGKLPTNYTGRGFNFNRTRGSSGMSLSSINVATNMTETNIDEVNLTGGAITIIPSGNFDYITGNLSYNGKTNLDIGESLGLYQNGALVGTLTKNISQIQKAISARLTNANISNLMNKLSDFKNTTQGRRTASNAFAQYFGQALTLSGIASGGDDIILTGGTVIGVGAGYQSALTNFAVADGARDKKNILVYDNNGESYNLNLFSTIKSLIAKCRDGTDLTVV
jgi:hypothetical protein